MIMDSTLEFCDAVSVALAAGTANIGNQVDTVNVRDLGGGQPIFLVINVDTAIVTGGVAGTLQFALVSDDTAAISTTTRAVHLLTAAFVTDDDPTIPAGRQLYCGAIPSLTDYVSRSVAGVDVVKGAGSPYARFLGIQAIVGTTPITAGKINAFLTLDPHTLKNYPDAQN